jgi:hypothetical protein
MKIVVGICVTNLESDSGLGACIDSLLSGTLIPDEIMIASGENNIIIPEPLTKRAELGLGPAQNKDYGVLNVVLNFAQRYKIDEDVALIILNSECIYPSHLVQEYVSSVPELSKSLMEQLPESNNSVYGLSGYIMTEDKNKNLDNEFKRLTEDIDIEIGEKLTVLSQVVHNATVHYLDYSSSIFIHRRQIDGDFGAYVTKVWTNEQISTDVILCNYLASKRIVRTQICNIFINRFMMDRMGCFKMYKNPCNEKLYIETVKHLRNINAFYVY